MARFNFTVVFGAALTLGLSAPACYVDDVKVGGENGYGGYGGSGGGGKAGTGGSSGSGGSGGRAGSGGSAGVGGSGGQGGAGGGPSGEGGGGDPWGCVGIPPPEPSGDFVDFGFKLVRVTTLEPVTDVKVRACAALDIGCTAPVVDDQPPFQSGLVTMRLPASFRGYFEVRGVEEGKYVPELVSFGVREFQRVDSFKQRVFLFTPSDAGAFTTIVGGSFFVEQPPNALVLATALDCRGAPFEGVTFALTEEEPGATEETVKFYVDENELPNTTLSETSTQGTFGLTNMEAGLTSFSAYVNPLARSLPNTTAITRDGWVTAAYVSP